MASPEVCRALPITTWSTHAGSTRVRSRAARDAWPPSSRAETSLNAPTYSAMAVRAPPRITTSAGMLRLPPDPDVEAKDYSTRGLTVRAGAHYAAHQKHACATTAMRPG